METVQTGVEPVKRERDIERVYRTVNEAWGRPEKELPPLTGPEAIAAVKRLRKVAGAPVSKRVTFKLTSGRRRYTWTRRGIYFVNPTRGWWHLVHDVSHKAHRILHPGKRPHDASEAYLERALIEHVVSNGWLDGKLKRPEKPKSEKNAKAERHARALDRMKTWESKRKRAETAIKKLKRQIAYYERQSMN